ncbi:hypothetical protein BJV77DRAFT_986108 [Russula vinacea]|nr:hypothetical protein BJV77DRAFT_986108 [Russula vinacea]
MRYLEHSQSMRLLLVGGVRNEGDSARVKELKEFADSLQVSEYVDFVVNAPYPRILELLGEANWYQRRGICGESFLFLCHRQAKNKRMADGVIVAQD